MYANTSSSILSDIIYKTEGSSNDDTDKGGTDNNDEAYEEESNEIEEELKNINKLIEESNDAMILDELLPESQKNNNAHLNAVRKDPHVKEFFEGKTPEIKDLPELKDALKESREEKLEELSEAKNYAKAERRAKYKEICEANNSAKDESSNNSLRDQSNSSLHESDNTSNNKHDNHDSLGYKVLPSLLEFIIDLINNLS
jgi:hypothetical protein